MPRKNSAKTKSGLSDRAKVLIFSGFAFVALGLLMFLVGFVVLAALPLSREGKCAINIAPKNTTEQCVQLEQAITQRQKSVGLAKYDSIPDSQGMVFVYSYPNQACFWMKDMKFDIDIIWLNAQKEITKIERNVRPDTFPQTFCSDNTSKYVIEVNDGVADRAGLRIGQILDF